MKQPPATEGDFLHKEYPKRFARNQFWQQIKRTVNGKPVSDHEIEMIVKQVATQLDLREDDRLLDLGCGNGALASRFFNLISSYMGVDFSDYLLKIAREFFLPHEQIQYRKADIRDVPSYIQDLESVNKVLCYGCIAYLSKEDVESLLRKLKQHLPRLKNVFIGNIPRREMADEFFSARGVSEGVLDNPNSTIGVWWETEEFEQMATRLSYLASQSQMPAGFYGASYRFDMLLELNFDSNEAGTHE